MTSQRYLYLRIRRRQRFRGIFSSVVISDKRHERHSSAAVRRGEGIPFNVTKNEEEMISSGQFLKNGAEWRLLHISLSDTRKNRQNSIH